MGGHPSLLSGCTISRVHVRKAADDWIFLRSYWASLISPKDGGINALLLLSILSGNNDDVRVINSPGQVAHWVIIACDATAGLLPRYRQFCPCSPFLVHDHDGFISAPCCTKVRGCQARSLRGHNGSFTKFVGPLSPSIPTHKLSSTVPSTLSRLFSPGALVRCPAGHQQDCCY
jgi:hypothetical protein